MARRQNVAFADTTRSGNEKSFVLTSCHQDGFRPYGPLARKISRDCVSRKAAVSHSVTGASGEGKKTSTTTTGRISSASCTSRARCSAIYQGLYCRLRVAPLILAIIQPGALGGEWEMVDADDSFFKKVVRSNPAGMPEYLLYGGLGERGSYAEPCWHEYRGKRIVQLPERYAGLWKRNSGKHCGFVGVTRHLSAGLQRLCSSGLASASTCNRSAARASARRVPRARRCPGPSAAS